MIAATVLERTFRISYGSSEGTAFVLDFSNKQYLITASHVVRGLEDQGEIEIFHEREWKRILVTVVFLGDAGNNRTDVAVLATNFWLVYPVLIIEPSLHGIMLGQQLYFCGFPYGFSSESQGGRGYPIPIVKGALLSGTLPKEPDNSNDVFFLDGHSNPGFSGGPVVFKPGENQYAAFQWLGVVVGSWEAGREVTSEEGRDTGLTATENTGIIICASIDLAIRAIIANPRGFPIG